MKRIYFKNGSHLDITQELLEVLYNRITEGCNAFQLFKYNDKTEIVINIQEIVFITKVP